MAPSPPGCAARSSAASARARSPARWPRASPDEGRCEMRGAVIGCGYFAQFHRDAWARLPLELAAICDADRAKAEGAAREFPSARVFTDAAAMLDEVRP